MQIDDMDRQLIALLAENARAPVAKLARATGLARTTVQARLDRLERGGAIGGYTIRKGPGLTPALTASVLVSVEPRAEPAVIQRLRALPGVMRATTTSGRTDLLVEVTAETTEALDALLDRIGEAKGVRSSESLIHLTTKIAR
ncbi:Lrp/AsnC family transcriptional regulator [Roseivivax sp. GX 12232]|uniref:Lrp/AsnC family transcriptional regulator n=1 Tax=Roseivivax sp. GX 12232 TaxID=2900547 RepID=UPI001E439024|nr:Lrp/AsnC family transcriptional regulator [Roseivivax sp. GX 12232]MCE0504306.1 Lrp/AsnC family transcriptional regulator [Roseivivax sp. GX 12232]